MVILNDFVERALKRITPIYEDSAFIQEFFRGISFDDVRGYFHSLREQRYIETVDFGIEYQEHKYSLEPRPDLSLKERRARLGIKAQIHRPLNPKRLEQAIQDTYGLVTYLYEKVPGYILLCANYMTEESYRGAIEFLTAEKPAHLALKMLIDIDEHSGGDDGAPSVWNDERKNYPRVFAGIASVIDGEINIGLPPPDNELINLQLGTAQFVEGDIKISHALPSNELVRPRVGVAMDISGEIVIGCDYRVTPYHEIEIPMPGSVVEPYYINENPIANIAVADVAIARGALTYIPPEDEIESLEYDTVKLFFDFPISRHRRVRGVALPNARPDLTREEIQQTGQYAVDNELITNAAGELASGVTKAALKTRETTRVF